MNADRTQLLNEALQRIETEHAWSAAFMEASKSPLALQQGLKGTFLHLADRPDDIYYFAHTVGVAGLSAEDGMKNLAERFPA